MAVRNSSNGKPANPPKHLSAEMRKFWQWVCSTWALEKHDLLRLRTAAEAFDRMQQARKIIDSQGMTYADSRGNPRVRPECKVEKESRDAWLKALRELGIDIEDPAEVRMPRDQTYGRRA